MEFIAFELSKLLSLRKMKALRKRLAGIAGLVVAIDYVLVVAGHRNEKAVTLALMKEKVHYSVVRDYRLEQVRKSYA